MDIVELLPILIATISAVGSGYAILSNAKKSKADALSIYEDVSSRQANRIDALQKQIDDLEVKLRIYLQELNELRAGVALLILQLEANKLIPVWKPSDKTIPKNPDAGD